MLLKVPRKFPQHRNRLPLPIRCRRQPLVKPHDGRSHRPHRLLRRRPNPCRMTFPIIQQLFQFSPRFVFDRRYLVLIIQDRFKFMLSPPQRLGRFRIVQRKAPLLLIELAEPKRSE